MHGERERFEQALADRDAQAQGRAAEVLAEAEDRKREAEALVAEANRVQAQVLGAIEQARSTLALPATPAYEPQVPAPVEAEEATIEPEAVEAANEAETETDTESENVDVFGFQRDSSQGSSLRSMIDAHDDEADVEADADASDEHTEDDAADASLTIPSSRST